MQYSIYSAPAYQMGDSDKKDAMAVTPGEKAKAEAEIKRMQNSLKAWLKYRKINNEVAEGKRSAKIPPGIYKKILSSRRDWALEQRMALELHALLSEVFDAAQLPDPDMSKNPEAAVELAKIAIAGKLPSEAQSAEAQGIIWLWPAVVVVGLVLMTIMSKIRNDADVAKEKEHIECIKSGACTDYGFWLKIGGIALVGWIVWDKMGLREKIAPKKTRRVSRRR